MWFSWGCFMQLDKRCKFKYRALQNFYLYRRDKRNGIFYCRFRDGQTISTKETDIRKALVVAEKYFNDEKKSQNAIPHKTIKKPTLKNMTLVEVLKNYYQKDGEFVQYDERHGTHYLDNVLKFNNSMMSSIANNFDDEKMPSDVTRKDLIALQEKLLERGLSGKTVNNYLSIMRKIFLQLLDKEIISSDPFVGLKPCSYVKELRSCFPLPKIKGCFKTVSDKFDDIAFIACCTGMRKGEIERIQENDIIEKDGKLWLKVRGTKTVYSVRDVPLLEEAVPVIKRFCKEKYIERDWRTAVLNIGAKIGFDEKYVQENHIVFHSFRKLYKTLLTQANLNTSLVEMLMGHTTNNQMSNDVERIYFVSESADLSEVHKKVVEVLQYLIN